MKNDLVTCTHCGIVKRGHQCPYKKSRQREKDKASDKFRKTKAWTNKSIEIREKSKYLCAVCLEGKYHTTDWLNYKNLEVHHIVPVKEDYNRRLDNENLVCLCSFHHHMAENGQIPRNELFEMARKREADEIG